MIFFRSYTYSLIHLLVLALSFITDWYTPLSYLLIGAVFTSVLDKLGKGVVLREIISLHLCFLCLAMPLLGYAVYNRSNALALLWVRYMPVAQSIYFSYALPAIAAFVFGLCWPINNKTYSDQGEKVGDLLQNIKEVLGRNNMHKKGIYFVIIGITMLFLSPFMPTSLRFISILFYFSSFAGILYIFYAPPFKYKVSLLILFVLFILANSLRSGMFTIVAYMGFTMFSFLFIGKRMHFVIKTALFLLCVFLLVLIQSVKPTYRKYTWKSEYQGSRAELFLDLVSEKVEQGDFFTQDAFFPIFYRINQGYNVALVMRRIPSVQQYDGGLNLFRNIASSLVPRVLWPNKPEAGGKFNMKYYTGYTIQGWSTNVGPMGEAYGSFGSAGGIVYMFFLGLFIRWAYMTLFKIARKLPLLICWLPVLFYQISYSAETDTLQIFNSLIKGAFFIWILFKLLPEWFGVIKENTQLLKKTRRPDPMLN